VNARGASRGLRLLLLCGAVLAWSSPGSGRQTPGADDWKYDVIHQRKGEPLRGLIVEETADFVRMKLIVRKPNRATLFFNEVVPRRDIARIDPLDPAEREVLRKRLETLAHEQELLDAQLRRHEWWRRGDAIPLEEVPWPPAPQRTALAYNKAEYFRLVSTASPEVTRLAVIRLEQVYAAYARLLPPRVASAKPTLILLAGSLDDYAMLLRGDNHNFFNPAFYDVKNNHIVCGSGALEWLAREREQVGRKHALARADLRQREADLVRAYKGRVPPEFLLDITNARKAIDDAEAANNRAFDTARRRLFQRLYHEAFHAYLATWVYPDEKVPVWLNEGLAQIFESAVVEVGEFRVGRPDGERVRQVRMAIKDDKLPSLKELLTSDSAQFLVNHARQQQVSDRYYLASWGLAFYLTFERRLLGTKAMDDYVKALQHGADPLDAFQALVGVPLPQFEKDYLQYLQALPTTEGAGP